MKTRKPSLVLAFIGLFLLTASSFATVRTWSGGGTDSTWTNTANWDVLPAVNGDSLTFTGTTQQNNTNTYTAITNAAVVFSTGGWTLNGSNVWLGGNITSSLGTNVMNMNTPLTAARTITVSAGQLTMNGAVSGAFGVTKGGVGTLVLGGTNSYTGTTSIASGAGIVQITNPKGLGTGSVSIPKAGTATSGLLQLNLSGVNTITNTFSGFASTTGSGTAVPDIENVAGTNTLTSALIVTSGGGNGVMVQSDAGLITLSGNIATTVDQNRYIEIYGAGNGAINGVIGVSAGSLAVTTNVMGIVKYGAGTWTLNGTNSTAGSLTINAGKVALGANGSISNAAAITLAAGTVFDVSSVPGGWTLNVGKTLQGSGTVTGSVITASGGAPVLTPGTTTAQGTLAFSNNLTLGGGTILNMNLSSDPSGTTRASDIITVAGNLTALGTNTIKLGSYLNGFIANGTYHIIKFGGALTGDATNFIVTNFAVGGRGLQNGYIITNTGYIDLVVTGTPPANLVWKGDGTANNWDITTTSNWLNGVSLDEFYNNDSVIFDDTATNFAINIPATVTPGSVTVNSTNSFTISGANITGLTGITKLGTGTLTLAGNNDFAGTTLFGGGNISVATIGNVGSTRPLGAGPQVFNGGALEYTGGGETILGAYSINTNGGTVSVDNPGVTLTVGTSGGWVSSGGNALTKTGPGTLYFSFQQVLAGTNTVKGGILKLSTVSVFGTDLIAPILVNSGGELDINAQTMSSKPVVVSGMGDLTINPGTTNGAIINSGASQTQGFQFVTLTGDTAFGGSGRWDIRANPTASLSTGGNAYNLVKVGANQVSIVGATVDAALADIDLRQGILSYETGTTSMGNPTNTLTVEGGGTFQMFNAANALNKKIVLADNATIIAGSGANTIVGPVTMLGDTASGPTFNVAAGVTLNLNGVISGAGNLTKTGNGILALAATNSYAGTTTVSAGKLVFGSAQIGLGSITVNDGAVLGVTVSGNSQLNTDTLNLGTGASAATNEFNAVVSTTTAPVHATNLNVNSTITINIPSGNFLTGQTYPLIAFDNLNGGGGFVVGTLPSLVIGTLVTNGNTIALNVTSSTSIEIWSGAVNGNWNSGTPANWKLNGAASTYANGNNVLFDDTASNGIVNVTATVLPKSVNVNNNTLAYSFTGSSISSTGSLTKLGNAALTIYNANSYTGGTILSAGTLNIDNNGALGTGPLTINAGIIDNNGSGPVTLTNNNVQNWNTDIMFTGNQDLNLGTGVVTVNADRLLAINGSTLTVGGAIGDTGNGYMLTKNGAGTLILSGTNTYTGGTTVNVGTLVLQGNQVAANGGLVVGPASTGGAATIAPGAMVSVAAGKQIQVGNAAGANGTIYINFDVSGTVTNNGSLLAARSSIITLNTNSVWVQAGDMEIRAMGGYYGQMNANAGSTFNYTGANTIKLNGADGNIGRAVLNVAGLFITPVAFEQTTTPTTGLGEVVLTGGTLKLAAAIPDLSPINSNPAAVVFVTTGIGGTIDTAGFDSYISAGVSGSGKLIKAGAGALTLETASYTGNTVISGGTLALTNAATLASTNLVIAGGAKLDVSGLTTLPLTLFASQTLTNSSSTAILNGSVDATSGQVGLTYTAGTPSLNITNGTLTLAGATPFQVNNTGATLANGSYKLISIGTGGSVAGTLPTAVTVIGNGLGSGGTGTLGLIGGELYLSVTGVVSVNTNSPVLTNSVSGNNLNLSWPTDHIGWRLVVQTNHLTTGVSANTNDWGTVSGSASTNKVSLPLDATKPTEFYRLVYP